MPWDDIETDSSEVYSFELNYRQLEYEFAGMMDITGIVTTNNDGDPTNDRKIAGNVVVYPEGVWVLGYDNRDVIRWFPEEFEEGNGPAVLYTPEDDGIDDRFDINAIRVHWNGLIQGQPQEVDVRLHIFEDDDGEPGQELYSDVITVLSAETNPFRQIIDLTDADELNDLQTDFWIWFELMRDDQLPSILGNVEHFGQDHYYRYDGDDLEVLEYEFHIHPILMPAGFDLTLLAAGYEEVDFEAIQPNTRKITPIALFNGGNTDVTIEEFNVEGDAFSVRSSDFDIEASHQLDIGEYAYFEAQFRPSEEGEFEGEITITSSADTPTVIKLIGVGDTNSSAPNEGTNQPLSFALGNAYPNPFNAQTVIPFTLPQAGDVQLTVYDLSGRSVKDLISTNLESGHHEVVFNADGLPAGVYLYCLEMSQNTAVRKVVFVK